MLWVWAGLSYVLPSLTGLIWSGASTLFCLSSILSVVPVTPRKINSTDADAALCLLSLWRDIYSSLELYPLSVQYSKNPLLGTISFAWRLNRKRTIHLYKTWHLPSSNINYLHSHTGSGCTGHWSIAPCLWSMPVDGLLFKFVELHKEYKRRPSAYGWNPSLPTWFHPAQKWALCSHPWIFPPTSLSPIHSLPLCLGVHNLAPSPLIAKTKGRSPCDLETGFRAIWVRHYRNSKSEWRHRCYGWARSLSPGHTNCIGRVHLEKS